MARQRQNEAAAVNRKTIIADELLRLLGKHGWLYAEDLSRVPTTTGDYALYDGIEPRACGVTWDMRKSVENATWYGRCRCQIIFYLPDEDGSAAAWLSGDMRKYRAIVRARTNAGSRLLDGRSTTERRRCERESAA